MSGIPYVTSSAADEVVSAADVNGTTIMPTAVHFPQVTRFFVIKAFGTSNLRVGFSENGVMNPAGSISTDDETHRNYFLIDKDQIEGVRLEVRCTDLFFLSDGATGNESSFSILAGLTGIDAGQFPILTGTVQAGTADEAPSFKGIG
jgi:hypothetical protein|tara:strand:- start:3168 stop:3608 length:441 start_codon:yes stop_codon:yes gene_type:complete